MLNILVSLSFSFSHTSPLTSTSHTSAPHISNLFLTYIILLLSTLSVVSPIFSVTPKLMFTINHTLLFATYDTHLYPYLQITSLFLYNLAVLPPPPPILPELLSRFSLVHLFVPSGYALIYCYRSLTSFPPIPTHFA